MKGKTFKRLLAGFLAAVCLPLGSVSALAENPPGNGGTNAAAEEADGDILNNDSPIYQDVNWARADGVQVTAHWTADGSSAEHNESRPVSRAVDGDKTLGMYGIFGLDNRQESSYLKVDLGEVRRISAVNMWRYWGEGREYYGTVIALSQNDSFDPKNPDDYKIIYNSDRSDEEHPDGWHGFGAGEDATYRGTEQGKSFPVDSGNPAAFYEARYIRVYMHGSSASDENHIVELEAVSHAVNWARATTGVSVTAGKKEGDGEVAINADRPLTMAVDGVIPPGPATSSPNGNYADFGNSAQESVYLQVDLGKARSISAVNLYRYWEGGAGRTYNGTVIVLSEHSTFENASDYQVIYNSDSDDIHGFGAGSDSVYVETHAGKMVMLDAPYEARYIRVYMHGSDKGGSNHIVELEALGRRVTVNSIRVSVADGADASLHVNDTLQLLAGIEPENALNKTTAWTSSDSEIASVDENGLVTGHKAGRVTITAEAQDISNVTGEIELSVQDESGEIPDITEPTPDLTGDAAAVVQEEDTITIGNKYIRRQFSIAGNKLRTTQISNVRTGTGADATVFTPAAGSEEFKIRVTKSENDTDPAPVSLPKIDKTGWTAVADSWQNASGSGDGPAQNLLDGSLDSNWHTKHGNNSGNEGCRTEFPYNVVINMKKAVTFQSFSYTPRKEGEDKNGSIKKYELYYYNGSQTTDLAADSQEWKLLKQGSFKYNGVNPIYVNLDAACTATQLKLVALSSNNGAAYAGGAEFDLHEAKADQAVQKNSREFVSSDLTLSGNPVIEKTEAEINGVQKTGRKVTFQFEPYTFRGVAYTISEVIVMYDNDHFMRKYMEISVPEEKQADAVIDYIDLESLVTSDTDATWTIPTDAGGVVEMDQFKANLGQPIYIQGMFFGCEFPAADNEIDEDDGTGYMRYYTGKSFARLKTDNQLTKDGKYVTWQTVAGAARSTENAVIQADFFEYIKSIATPSEFRIQYNSWFDNMMNISDENILASFIEIDRELNKAGVRPLDSYVVDDGWNNYNKNSVVSESASGTSMNQSGFWEFNNKFPDELTPSSELVHKFGSNFGVWVGPRGGYNYYGTMADILTEHGTGSKAGGSIDVADRTYVENFTDMAVKWMEDYKVNYWKWDGFADTAQYGQWSAADGVPGYANHHMTGGYRQMYHVTDLWEAWIDLMERVRQCEKEEGINKLWISLTCYVNPSPWYLQWANSVWIQCTADQADAGSSESKMDRQMTYRDACYYDFLKNHEFQFPLSNIYNHDPIYGKQDTGININTATDEQFQNYLYMQSTRGSSFWELYYSDSIMTDGKYEVTAEFLEWAEENYHMLKNSKMFGASPNDGTRLNANRTGEQNAYGYACFDGTDGIISFRNPATTEKSVTITFDRTLGVPEDAGTLKYHMEHSHNLTEGVPETGELVYGKEYTFTLQPDEVRILRVSEKGDTTAPEISRAYSMGEDQVIVKFNEKVRAEGFTVNGIATEMQAGADDCTFHLTIPEGAMDDTDILTTAAEGVTDLAGNKLADNSRTFRYYADNAVVSAQHHTVRREEYLAKARDSLTGSSGFTVKTEFATGSTGLIVRQGGEYMLGIDHSGKAYFVLNGTWRVTSNTVVNDGFTHRVIGVKENNGMLKIYVDGELEASVYNDGSKDYDLQAEDIVLGNTDFYGSVKAEVKDVADGYDVIREDEELVAPGTHNWTAGKVVTAKWTKDDTDAPVNGQRPLTMAVDGVKDNAAGNHVQFGDDNRQGESSYLQVDFGGVRSVSSVNMYRYWLDGRTYDATVVALSRTADFKEPKIIYNSDKTGTMHGLGAGTDELYQETAAGKTFTLDEPYDARYIRVYMCSRSGSGTNHIVELEALGGSQSGIADYTAVNRARALAEFLLDNYKSHNNWYSNSQEDFTALETARDAVVENKPAAEQAAVDQMAAAIFTAASKIRKTDRKKLRNALEKAVLITPEEFYTADSIAAYDAEIAAAQAVFDNPNATDAQLTAALSQVNEAPRVLVTLLAGAEAELAEAIKAAEQVSNDPPKTAASWKAFQDAIKAAKDMLNRPLPAKRAADFAAAKKAITDTQAVLVDAKPITGVSVSSADGVTEMAVGDTLQLTAVVEPAGEVNDDTVTWSVVEKEGQTQDVVSVDKNGLVTARAAGEAEVMATANGDSSKTGVIRLSVKANLVTGITVRAEGGKTTLKINETVQLTADIQPEDADIQEVDWSIPEASKDVADVSESGLVTAKAAGEAVVTATAKDGSEVSGEITLTVTDDTVILVTGITVSAESGKTTLKINETVQLAADIQPEDADIQEVDWSISEASKGIADVSESGLVTAKAEGKAVVTATAKDGSGVSGEITLTVTGESTSGLDEAKQELGSAVSNAEAMYPASVKDKYTEDTWKKFQEALANAKAVQGNASSTADELKQARLALENAIKGLALADANQIEQGKTYTVGNYMYKVTNLSAKTVEVTGLLKTKANTVKKLVIGKTVPLNGTPYKITSVGKGAFKNNKKASSVTIGANVTKIGVQAFYGCKALKTAKITSKKLKTIGKQAFANCKKLKKITIKSAKLKTVGKNTFKGIYKKATIKVPAKQLKKYKKLLKKGQGKQVKIKK